MDFHSSNRGRITILVTIMILFLVSVYYSYAYVLAEEQVEKKERLLAYEHCGTFDYTFTIKDNVLYNEDTLQKGINCFTNIVDKLDVNYTSEMTFSDEAVCSSESRAYVDLYCDYWHKSEEITNVKSNDANLVTEFQIDFAEIVSFIEEVEENLSVHARIYNVDIRIPVDVKIEAMDQVINEKYEYVYTFEIESNVISPTDDEYEIITPGEISQTVTEIEKKSSLMKSGFVFLNIVLASSALLSYIYLKPDELSQQELIHNKAKKRFHDYMVDVYGQPPIFSQPKIPVSDLNEMARIAEGLNKPILHFIVQGSHKYFILTENVVYQFAA